jgi:hypothetical protein
VVVETAFTTESLAGEAPKSGMLTTQRPNTGGAVRKTEHGSKRNRILIRFDPLRFSSARFAGFIAMAAHLHHIRGASDKTKWILYSYRRRAE